MAAASAPVFGSMVDPKMMIETMELLGIKKARLPNKKIFALGVLAGVYVSIGGFLYTILTSEDHSPPYRILGGLGFSVALIAILFLSAELFTGNCLILLSVFVGDVKALEMTSDLIKVWFTNFLGCILGATLILGMGLGGYGTEESGSLGLNPVGQRLCAIAVGKANLNVWEMFTRGIAANIFVCLAVLQALTSKTASGKVLGVIFPVCGFTVFGVEHCIANMFFFSLATFYRCPVANHGWYWLDLVLSTLGNFVGAAFLCGMYYMVYLSHQKQHTSAEIEAAAMDKATIVAVEPVIQQQHLHDCAEASMMSGSANGPFDDAAVVKKD